MNGRETVRPFAGLMNFTIRPRNQRFQVTAGLWFGGKSRDFRQVRRSPLVEIMKMLQLVETELEARIVLQLVQKRFEIGPMPPLARNKFLEVDYHVPKWNDGALEQ